MSFIIKQDLAPANFTNKNDTSRIKYIVIHYFGSLGTAAAVSKYFKTTTRRVSAHYCLDDYETIYQCVEDGDIAWHCGTYGTYYHPTCRNSNSLGIEVRPYKRSTKTMYATDKDWYFTDTTYERLVEFTRYLMDKYKIPAENVVRHYDVTHKICPNPFVVHEGEWEKFKSRLVEPTVAPPHPGPLPIPELVPKPEAFLVKAARKLNIRSGPSSSTKLVGTITDSGKYTIVDKQGDWGKLKSGAGWIFLPYTKVLIPIIPTPEPDSYLVKVTAKGLNIRKGPGTTYPVVGVITDNGTYTIVETKGKWGKLKSGVGWIFLDYTRKL